jgi:cell division protein FtsW (lipid II flippase)
MASMSFMPFMLAFGQGRQRDSWTAARPAAQYDPLMNLAIETIGWVGAVLVLLAYGLLSAHKLDSRSVTYQMLNIGGSIGLVINTLWNGAIPSAAVNLIWMAIGVHALWRNARTPQEV